MASIAGTVVYAQGQLGSTITEIREWLDDEKIEPVDFKTLVGAMGIGFEISFKTEGEAERFQERFSALIA
jgi:hypothetical protein